MGFKTDLRDACRIIQRAVIWHGYRLDLRYLGDPDDKDFLAKEIIRNAQLIELDATEHVRCDACCRSYPLTEMVELPAEIRFCRSCHSDSQVP